MASTPSSLNAPSDALPGRTFASAMKTATVDEAVRVAGRTKPHATRDACAPPWIERHPWRAFSVLTAFYLLAVAGLSWVKLLWLDELITLHIARLGSVAAIWRALAAGADPNPPLIHVAVMLCRQLFGEHAFALRLPAVIGYWLGMLGLFLFLKRRVPAQWALAGTVLSMAMGSFEWSYESRSYAVFYGFTMLAFYSWTRRADAMGGGAAAVRTRRIALAGMTLSLAAGLCTNYFAALAFVPIAAAEITRSLTAARPRSARAGRGWTADLFARIDWPVWIGLVVAAAPLPAFRGMIATSIARFAPYAWNKVALPNALSGYFDMLAETLWLLIGLFVMVLGVEVLANLRSEARDRIRPRWFCRFVSHRSGVRSARLLSRPEAAAVSVFLAYPFLGYALATARGGMLSGRFVMPVCLGCAILGTLLAYRLFGPLRHGGAFALGFCLLWFAGREAYVGYNYEVQKESFYRVIAHTPAAEYPGQPLVIGDNLLVLPFQYYAPHEIASRVVYPIDFEEIMRVRGEASGEMNLWAGRDRVYDFPIVPMATLQRSTSTYLLMTSGRDWLVDDLRRHRYQVERLPIDTQAVQMDFWATPVGHGQPEIYRASGDLDVYTTEAPEEFVLSENLPKAK